MTDALPLIRDAAPADFTTILELNRAWEHFTSPLDEESLRALHEDAAYHRVVEMDGGVAAFLIAVGPGTGYGSVNYRWFDERGNDFLYIDRVIVDGRLQRSGFGEALYRDVKSFAEAAGFSRLACEVDVEPMNDVSHAFHERLGFHEVGTQLLAPKSKRVSLRECPLT